MPARTKHAEGKEVATHADLKIWKYRNGLGRKSVATAATKMTPMPAAHAIEGCHANQPCCPGRKSIFSGWMALVAERQGATANDLVAVGEQQGDARTEAEPLRRLPAEATR